jgi:mono/diheme cytochrome c family protein
VTKRIVRRAVVIHRVVLAILAPVLVAGLFTQPSVLSAVQAQEARTTQNPRAGDASAIVEGGAMFRTFCAGCHGVDARGGTRGPDLTSGGLVHGDTDAAIFGTITRGVPGTEMPPAVLEAEEMAARLLLSSTPSARPALT